MTRPPLLPVQPGDGTAGGALRRGRVEHPPFHGLASAHTIDSLWRDRADSITGRAESGAILIRTSRRR